MRHLWDSSWAPLDGAGVLQRAPREPQDGPKRALGANRSGASHGPASDAPLGSPFGALLRPSWAPQGGPRVPPRVPREPRGSPERAPGANRSGAPQRLVSDAPLGVHLGALQGPSWAPDGSPGGSLIAPRGPQEAPTRAPGRHGIRRKADRNSASNNGAISVKHSLGTSPEPCLGPHVAPSGASWDCRADILALALPQLTQLRKRARRVAGRWRHRTSKSRPESTDPSQS